jgi:hypothetical protein
MCCNVKVDTNLPELNEAKQDNLYLICARDTPWNDMLPAHLMLLARDHRVIIYNAKHEEISEQLLLMANVKGVFYHNDTPDILLKGISKILNDELWFKRSSICKAFGNLLAQQPKYAASEQSNDSSHLTRCKKQRCRRETAHQRPHSQNPPLQCIQKNQCPQPY